MLRELIDALRGKDPLSQMLNEFTEMIEDSEWMFKTACDVLLRKKDADSVATDLYNRDKEINGKERSIRRRIVEHLSLRPGQDVPSCLVLMSVVKDAERVGDMCKNIFDVARMYTRKFDHGRYMTPLQEIRLDVESMFSKARQAFRESDEAIARSIVVKNRVLAEKCDMLIEQLIRDNLPTDKAVAYTLLSRHFKRIAAHLTNIATAVVVPVDKIDFTDEVLEPKGGSGI